MFGIKRKPDPLFLLGLSVGLAALITTAADASELAGSNSLSNTVAEFNLPIVSGFPYEDSAGFAITKNRKGGGLFVSFRETDEMRNTFLKTGASGQRGLKDMVDMDVKLSYRISW